jgi:hypothetical protein
MTNLSAATCLQSDPPTTKAGGVGELTKNPRF